MHGTCDASLDAPCEDCPKCKGTISLSDPALSRLEFATRLIGTHIRNAFWAIAQVAEHVRRSAGGAPTHGDEQVAGFLRRMIGLTSGSVGQVTDSTPGRRRPMTYRAVSTFEADPDWVGPLGGLRFRSWSRPPEEPPDGQPPSVDVGPYRPLPQYMVGPDVPFRGSKPGVDKPVPGGGDGGPRKVGRRCCVQEFEYPVYVQDTSDEKRFAFEFWARGVYEESKVCACDCCFFAQFVRHQINNSWRSDEFRQDCRLPGKSNTVERDPGPKEQPECTGGSWSAPPGRGLLHAKRWEVPTQADGPETCHWWFWDEPYSEDRKQQYQWHFVGVIFDRCRNWQIMSIKGFAWSKPPGSGSKLGVTGLTGDTTPPPPDGVPPRP